jgi:hypothetical protein
MLHGQPPGKTSTALDIGWAGRGNLQSSVASGTVRRLPILQWPHKRHPSSRLAASAMVAGCVKAAKKSLVCFQSFAIGYVYQIKMSALFHIKTKLPPPPTSCVLLAGNQN